MGCRGSLLSRSWLLKALPKSSRPYEPSGVFGQLRRDGSKFFLRAAIDLRTVEQDRIARSKVLVHSIMLLWSWLWEWERVQAWSPPPPPPPPVATIVLSTAAARTIRSRTLLSRNNGGMRKASGAPYTRPCEKKDDLASKLYALGHQDAFDDVYLVAEPARALEALGVATPSLEKHGGCSCQSREDLSLQPRWGLLESPSWSRRVKAAWARRCSSSHGASRHRASALVRFSSACKTRHASPPTVIANLFSSNPQSQ